MDRLIDSLRTMLCVLAVKSCCSWTPQLRSPLPDHSFGWLTAVFVLRLNVPNILALLPQFTILRSNKERVLISRLNSAILALFWLISAKIGKFWEFRLCPVYVGSEYGSQGPHPVESPVNLEKPAKNLRKTTKNGVSINVNVILPRFCPRHGYWPRGHGAPSKALSRE